MKKILTIAMVAIMAISSIAICSEGAYAASKSTYWLKVNKSCNVVNVYKLSGGTYQPYKVMICSTGKKGSTPKGTFSVKKKWKWQPLFGHVYGKYTTQFKGNYLFHSVPYKKKNDNWIKAKEYNKLGQQASKGCVRLTTSDARWIYYNCPKGTKVTVYSSNPGPLGKPKALKMTGSYGYDPANIDVKSKCRLTGPEISISEEKSDTVDYGSRYDLREGVTARSPYTYQNLTGLIGVSIYKYDENSGSYIKIDGSRLDTSSPGEYKILYKCQEQYCGYVTSVRTFYLKVNPEAEETGSDEEKTTDNSDVTDIIDNEGE